MNTTQAFQFFQMGRAGAAVLVSIVLAKSGWDQLSIGNFEFLLFAGMLMSFWWLNAALQVMASQYGKLKAGAEASYFGAMLVFFVGVTGILGIIFYAFGGVVLQAFGGLVPGGLFRLWLLYLLLSLPSSLVEMMALLKERVVMIMLWGMLTFGLYVLIVSGTYWGDWELDYLIQALIGLGLIRFSVLMACALKWAHFRGIKAYFVPFFRELWPLTGTAFLAGAAVLVDNYLVTRYFPGADNYALFRYGARELPLAPALVSGLSASMLALLASQIDHQGGMRGVISTFRSKSLRVMHIVFPFSIVLLLSVWWWFPLVFNPDFQGSIPIFSIYLLLVLSRVLMPNTLLQALGDNRPILVVSIFELLFNIVLSLVLMGPLGMKGIAMATVVAFFFEKIALMVYLKRKYSIAVHAYTPLRWYILYASLLLIAWGLGAWLV